MRVQVKKTQNVNASFIYFDFSGSPFTEGFFLRSKMYHIENERSALNKSTAKGITKAAKEKYCTYEAYKNALYYEDNITLYTPHIKMRRIQSDAHKLYTVVQEKKGLSSFNDKIYVKKGDNSFICHSYGHYKLPI